MLLTSFLALGQNGNGGSSGNGGGSHSSNYYLYPVSPGSINTLAGTMGELRSSHFHSGIDVRTGGVQGKPILAAADGFISRVNVNPGGYGNALYLQHPNGQTTVYAHLKEFHPDIQEYVTVQQYNRETFAINLFPEKGQFVFSKGDTIALSGNSGSSGGPHLHFDIRDKNQKVLNPLKYGFKEVIDTRPPEARTIALTTMDIDSRVNGQFGKFHFPLKRTGRNYTTLSPIGAFGKIGIQLFAFDRQDYTRFRTGIYRITMEIDGYLAFEQKIDTYAFSEGRNFYVHIDYEELRKTGRRYHRLYIGDGNDLKFYRTNFDKGLLTFTDHCEHDLEIAMEDSYGNISKVLLKIFCESPFDAPVTSATPEVSGKKGVSYEVLENTLILNSGSDQHDSTMYASLYFKGNRVDLRPTYQADQRSVYLWNLRAALPDSADICSEMIRFPYNVMIPSEVPYTYYNERIDVNFRTRTLFDTAFVGIRYQVDTSSSREHFTIGQDIYPFRKNMEVTLKPDMSYNQDHARAYSVDKKGNIYFVGGEWDQNRLKFRSRNFGTYTIAVDSIAPQVKPLIINRDEIVFRIADNLSGIESYKLEVDGKWVLLNYDPKINRVWSHKLDSDKPFSGPLVLTVTDNSNNETIYKTKIN